MANAFTSYKDALAGKPTVVDEMDAKATANMLKLYDDTYAKVYKEIKDAKGGMNYATYAKQTQLMKQIGKELAKFQDEAESTLESDLKTLAVATTGMAIKDMDVLNVGVTKAESWHKEYNSKYVEQVMKDNFEHIASQTSNMALSVKQMLRREASQVMQRAAVEGLTRKEATKQLQSEIMKKDPTFQFVDKAGRKWDSRTYFEMLTRTLIHNTHREVYVNTLVNEGHDLAIISAHGAKDLCGPWERKVISLTGATPGYPTLAAALGSGQIFHPRCRHRVLAYNKEMEDAFAMGDEDAETEARSALDFLKTQDVAKEAEKAHQEFQALLDDPKQVIQFQKGKDYTGFALNGVKFDAGVVADEYTFKSIADVNVDEPELKPIAGKKVSTGVIIQEADGRLWVYEPKDHFGGYEHTFAKGGLEAGLTMQQNAIKEAFEETGLYVKINGYVGDYEKSTSLTRYYRAERIAGSPALAGWEADNVKLIPADKLKAFLNKDIDKQILDDFLNPPPKASDVEKYKHIYQKYVGKITATAEELDFAFKFAGDNMEVAKKIELEVQAEAKATKLKQEQLKAEQAAQRAKEAAAKLKAEEEAAALAVKTASYPDGYFDFDNFVQIGPQGGSNEGALFKHKQTGEKFYIKVPQSTSHARNEYLAAELYKLAGVDAPELHLMEWKDGRQAIASKWVDGLHKVDPNKASIVKKFHEGFAVDAWVADWDVVGLSYDNIFLTADGKAVRVDVGGSLLYRAQGGMKWDGDISKYFKVTETTTLRDAAVNQQSAKVFGKIADTTMMNSIKKVEKVTRAEIEAAVAKAGFLGKDAGDLITILVNRQKDLHDQRIEIYNRLKAAKKTSVPTGTRRDWWGFAKPTAEEALKVRDHAYYDMYKRKTNVRELMTKYKLTEEEAVALVMYTNGSYGSLNDNLRLTAHNSPEWVIAHTKVINSALAKLGSSEHGFYAGSVKRGISMTHDEVMAFQEKWKPGTIGQAEDFWSTSKGDGAFGGNVRLHIESKTGVYVSKWSEHPSEEEVLMPSGATYKVLKVENSGNELHFYMEEI